MYIDKIYTKLYSDRNWSGLDQLISEIKVFARKDYEGLSPDASAYLKAMRSEAARMLRQARKKSTQDIPKDDYTYHTYTTGGRSGKTITPRRTVTEKLPTGKGDYIREVQGNKNFLNDYMDNSDSIKKDMRSLAENYHNYGVMHPDYVTNKSNYGGKWSKRLDNDSKALQDAIDSNKSNFIGDKNVGRLNTMDDLNWEAGNAVRYKDADEWKDRAGNRHFIPHNMKIHDTQQTPESRSELNNSMKGKLFKGYLNPSYDETW